MGRHAPWFRSAADIVQSAMPESFGDLLENTVVAYHDDILAFSTSAKEHGDRLHEIPGEAASSEWHPRGHTRVVVRTSVLLVCSALPANGLFGTSANRSTG